MKQKRTEMRIELFKLIWCKIRLWQNLRDIPDADLAGDLGTTAEIKAETLNIDCGKSKCPTMTVYRTQFSGKENLVDRNCALELAPSNKKMIVLSICAHGERTYAPDLAEILNQVFSMGTWKL